MNTQVVFDYLYDTSGKPVVGAKVTSTLNFAGASDTNPIVNIGPLQQTTSTDSNGYWQFNLIPNPVLTPTGTTYTIESPYNSYSISVPNSAGPFQSSSILGNVPSVISPAVTGLTGPITVVGNETVTGNLTVQGTTTLGSTTTGALSATANSGVNGDWTILSPGRLLFTASTSKIVPGATSISHRNNADSADNLLITDVGAVTIRNGLTLTAGIASVPTGAILLALAGSAGAPTSGTWSAGQIYIDSGGATFVCVTSGTPGTWVAIGTGRYHAEVYLSGAQSISNNTVSIVAFDTVDADPNSNFTTGAAAHYTAPAAGRYLVTSTIDYLWGANASVAAYLSLFKNGSEYKRAMQVPISANATNPQLTASVVARCAAGDSLDLRTAQVSGGALSLFNSSLFTWAQFTYLGAN